MRQPCFVPRGCHLQGSASAALLAQLALQHGRVAGDRVGGSLPQISEFQSSFSHLTACPSSGFGWVEKDWTDEDRQREKVLMQELVTIIEQRNAIVNCLDEDRQR